VDCPSIQDWLKFAEKEARTAFRDNGSSCRAGDGFPAGSQQAASRQPAGSYEITVAPSGTNNWKEQV